ncbi:hypothetical protein [Phosphitispora sp. TUW77]|uniref:hypothetical protein n=1 Tax=Phosphitispora sp. TUW77 TaxID=3152361 RepID=UPI003AB273D0
MCVSIIFAIDADTDSDKDSSTVMKERLTLLGESYRYGIGVGRDKLPPGAGEDVLRIFSESEIVFEVHDLAEPHCACDIDHDIRIGSKTGTKSVFFDFVEEVLNIDGLYTMSILFFQEELPTQDNIRKQSGTYEDFVAVLNNWHTWQVPGFEPTREAHFIADESPMLFTFTDKGNLS